MVILLQGVWSNIEDTGKLETQRRVLMVSVETMLGSYETEGSSHSEQAESMD